MRRSAWLDHEGIRVAIVFALVAALCNAIWIFLDNTTPSWDQSYYLTDTLQYRFGFAADGIHGLLSVIHTKDPAHGPLFTTAMLPFFYAFGNAPRSGLILNILLAPVFYLAAGQIAWIVFRSWLARLVTILLVATMPLMVGLYHEILQDFLLVTLATVSVLLLLMCDRFRDRWLSLALGLAMALGTLTKVTFPIFVVGPILVVLVQIALSTRGEGNWGTKLGAIWPQVKNMLGAAVVYLVLILPWYVTNYSETVEYVRSTTSGPLSEGVGPTNPFTFHAIASFTTGMVNSHVSWIIALAGLIAVGLCIPKLRNLLQGRGNPELPAGLAMLLAWALIPYLLIVTAHNQDVRLMAPAMPAMAILVAGAVSAVPQPRVRAALIAITAILLIYQSVNHVTRITPGFTPDDISLRIGSYEASIPLDERPIGYQRLPGPDYGTRVIEHIEEVARNEPRGFGPRTICMLESESVINTNTFTFLAESRGDPFQYWDIFKGPGGDAELREVMSGCDFALYVKQPKVTAESADERITIVNEDYAANHMTPALFGLFEHPSKSFVVAPGLDDDPTAGYLAKPGRGNRVWILRRDPSAR